MTKWFQLQPNKLNIKVSVTFWSFVFGHMKNKWIYVTSSVCQASWLAVFHDKNFNIWNDIQNFLPVPISSIFAMLSDTIDLYHFIPFSMALTLAAGYKVSR